MIELDIFIKQILYELGIEFLPFSLDSNGKVLVADLKFHEYGCIVKTIDKFRDNLNGTVDITSVFYLFSCIENYENVLYEINPKSENNLKQALKIIRKFKEAPFTVNPMKEPIDMTTYENITTASEIGISFNLTFRMGYSQCE